MHQNSFVCSCTQTIRPIFIKKIKITSTYDTNAEYRMLNHGDDRHIHTHIHYFENSDFKSCISLHHLHIAYQYYLLQNFVTNFEFRLTENSLFSKTQNRKQCICTAFHFYLIYFFDTFVKFRAHCKLKSIYFDLSVCPHSNERKMNGLL